MHTYVSAHTLIGAYKMSNTCAIGTVGAYGIQGIGGCD